ncbi:MAG: hypothetical protein ACKOAA_02175, partial [Actinomycetota bacterium]
ASSFSQTKIVPGYWFRTDGDGKLTSASGCGNDSASERSMVRKFIVDSVKYWASEYNLGGFRFDLMGLHDIETMRQVRSVQISETLRSFLESQSSTIKFEMALKVRFSTHLIEDLQRESLQNVLM